MTKFEAKKFEIGNLVGISPKTIEEHIKLYEGYVKHANLILEEIEKRDGKAEEQYLLNEARRRFGFEFDGMRNHEVYFDLLSGGASAISDGALKSAIEAEWGSFDNWLAAFKRIALTRGIGWAILYHDPVSGKLLNAWIDEQHLGQLTGCKQVVALDMWEHSFVADYLPSGKTKYVEDFFANLNWKKAEGRFA